MWRTATGHTAFFGGHVKLKMETTLFKIDFFVDDKYLAEVLRVLAGRTRNLSVVPVANAVPLRNGAIKQEAGHTLGLFLKQLKEQEVINAKTAKDASQKAGLSPASYSHLLASAVKQGLIKRRGKGKGTKYEWA